MSDAFQSPSDTTMTQPGSVIIADFEGVFAPLSEAHLKAIEARGLEPELLAMRGVRASNKLGGDAIAIPFHVNGAVVGIKHRTLSGEKKFTQEVGSRQSFYNVDCLQDESLKHEPLVICEGEMDCFAAMQAGYVRSVSVPGGAPSQVTKGDGGKKYAFVDEVIGLLNGVKTIILATDDDDPGRNLRQDLAIRLGAARCKFLRYPKGCKDLNDALKAYGVRGVQQSIQRAQWMAINGYFEMEELPELPEARAYATGMIGLGEHYKMRLGDFAVITGIPGHGKTSFTNEITCRMAQKHGWKTVFASFEQMPQTDHRRALRTFHAEKLEAAMSLEEKQAADKWIAEHFGFIVPSEDDEPTLQWFLETAAQAILRKEAKILVLDPWNELDHVRPPDMTQTEYVGMAIKTLKKFARKYNVHLIVLAHPAKMLRTKDGKFPFPGLYDISDSAHWSNKPDVGIVVHREDVSKNDAVIRIVKARYASIGKPGEISGVWNVDRTRYTITDDGGMRGAA